MIPDPSDLKDNDFCFSPQRESCAQTGNIRALFFQTPLRRSLVTVIFLKILFLTVFWQAVLKHQAVHVDAADMSDRIILSIPAKHAGEQP